MDFFCAMKKSSGRLIIGILFQLSSLVTLNAYADSPSPQYRPWFVESGWFSSKSAACASESNTTSLVIANPDGTNSCKSVRQSDGMTSYFSLTVGPMICSNGTAPDTTKPLAEQCAPPPPVCTQGVTGTATWNLGTAGCKTANTCTNLPPVNGTNGSCQIKLTSVTQCYSSGGSLYCQYGYTQTGAAQAPGTGTPAPSPGAAPAPADPRVNMPPMVAETCPAGSVSGGLDPSGMNICIGTGTAPVNAPPKSEIVSAPNTVTNPDSSVTATQTRITSNVDGSATTTTTTTNTAVDGTVTTSSSQTTSNASGGTSPGTQDRPERESDLCKLNPNLTVCQNSTVSGSCKETACTGDAIMCAVAKQTAEANCKAVKADLDMKASPEYALGGQAMAGTLDGLPTKTNASLVALPSFDSSGWLGGGSCFADKSFVIQGKTIVIPFSSVCDYLLVLRYALMVVSMLVSFRILSGAIIKE